MGRTVLFGVRTWGILGIALSSAVLAGCTMPPPDPGPVTTTTVDPTTTTSTTTTVPANQLPVASFSVTPSFGEAPLVVAFDATASSDADGSVVSYDWTFGDGSSATGATASHTYASIGTFTATLFVTDDDGAISSTTRTVRATGPTTSVAPSSAAAGGVLTATVPCAPKDGWVNGAMALASLVASDGTILTTGSVENTDPTVARVGVALTVPAGTAAGAYSVTSSCDTYLGSTEFDAVPVTVG